MFLVLGGSVIMMRVNGSLAVSRALGDFEYKDNSQVDAVQQLVSPEPEVTVVDRDEKLDEYMVVACDGIWDELSNEDLCAFVSSRLKVTNNLEEICNDVIDTCLHKGSRDNMSIILITFPAAPTVCEEAVKAEEDLHERLKARIDQLMDQENITSINEIHQALNDFEGEHLSCQIDLIRSTLYSQVEHILYCSAGCLLTVRNNAMQTSEETRQK